MEEITHSQLVAALTKPGTDILASLTPEKCNLWHLASCVPGEGGELFDAVKKHVIYEKEIDRANVIEELGDLEFYMQGVRTALGITREETLAANIAKLRTRYEKKTGQLTFTNVAAQERLDKADREGFQMTRERRVSNADWPQWLHEAWNKPRKQISSVGPYCMDDPSTGRISLRIPPGFVDQPVEWGQWIVRDPGGALSIETDFKP